MSNNRRVRASAWKADFSPLIMGQVDTDGVASTIERLYSDTSQYHTFYERAFSSCLKPDLEWRTPATKILQTLRNSVKRGSLYTNFSSSDANRTAPWTRPHIKLRTFRISPEQNLRMCCSELNDQPTSIFSIPKKRFSLGSRETINKMVTEDANSLEYLQNTFELYALWKRYSCAETLNRAHETISATTSP